MTDSIHMPVPRGRKAPPVNASTEPAHHPLSSNLLHDLRTPLHHVIGYSELLMEQAQSEGQDDYLADIKRIRTAGACLLTLINENFGLAQTNDAPAPAPVVSEALSEHQTNERHILSSLSTPVLGMVLVVDDSAPNRDVLTRHLTHQGFDVTIAENGQVALETLAASEFDLVLLDVMMPDMDGFEVLRRLKADDNLKHLPVIMISAMSEMEAAVRCIEMGAEDYLAVPFDPTLLRARTTACLERKRAHDREIQFTRELQESYRRGLELEQMREDLTDMIFHDLRTPLTSVISGLLTIAAACPLEEAQAQLLDISVAGGRTLLSMIDDLLDISKIEAGSMQLNVKPVILQELLDDAFAQTAHLAAASRLELVQDLERGLTSVTADQDKLLRTLVNLIGNAIKFTPGNGMIKVGARRSNSGASALFSVSDTGAGIPLDASCRIFDKFGQVESRTSGNRHSTGLGLTFCKLVAEAHGGRIWVESEMNVGSTFCFTIPFTS